VHFPDARAGWLDWASPLAALRSLRLAGAPMRLQPEQGLDALLPLRSCLTALALTDCLLLTDAGVARLAPLRALRRLDANWCQLGQAGVDALAAALPQLSRTDLRLLDGVAGGWGRLPLAARARALCCCRRCTSAHHLSADCWSPGGAIQRG
jgi:hypothetical protein